MLHTRTLLLILITLQISLPLSQRAMHADVRPYVGVLSDIFDVKSWLTPHSIPLHNHSHPHIFRFSIDLSGNMVMYYKIGVAHCCRLGHTAGGTVITLSIVDVVQPITITIAKLSPSLIAKRIFHTHLHTLIHEGCTGPYSTEKETDSVDGG